MTTISSSSAAQFSPKQHLLDRIATQVGAGKISATDQTALDAAVDDIDSSLSDKAGSGTSSSKSLDPSQMKSRIDDLIAGEVSKGTLTSDQADTLKQVLSQGVGAGSRGGSGGAGGPGGAEGPGGAGGPPPGPPPAQNGSSSSSSGDDASSATGSSSASSLLASFIQQLQASQGMASGYASNGTTDASKSASKSASALLLNFEA